MNNLLSVTGLSFHGLVRPIKNLHQGLEMRGGESSGAVSLLRLSGSACVNPNLSHALLRPDNPYDSFIHDGFSYYISLVFLLNIFILELD
jgi:hypothetical protein